MGAIAFSAHPSQLAALQASLRTIDGFAATSGSAATVYAAASIDPPARRGTMPAPGRVRNLVVTIDPVRGAAVLRWKGSNPRGGGSVTYMVARQLLGERGWTFLGFAPNSGRLARTFTDATLPAGTPHVRYTVTPVRGAAQGPAAELSVQLGVPKADEQPDLRVAA